MEQCLTSNHLLYSCRLEPHSLVENPKLRNLDPVTYSKHLTALLTHFWHRYRTEYLTELRKFHKCSKRSNSSKFIINENDVIIVQDNSTPGPFWRLAIVVATNKDNKVRGTKVRFSDHCVKSVRNRSYSGPHFPAFGLNT